MSYPHLSPQESLWKTNLVIVRSRGTGASPVLSHCKSRKCSKLSRFLLDWSQPEPLIRVDQFINISRESLKISTSGVCVNIFPIQCKVVPNSRLIPDFTCHGRRMEDGWMSTMGSKTPMHLSVEQEAALETGGAQLLMLILNNCKINHYQHFFLHLIINAGNCWSSWELAVVDFHIPLLRRLAFQEDDKRRKPLHPSYPRV